MHNFFLLLLLILPFVATSNPKLDSLYSVLDEEINKAPSYLDNRLERINNLKEIKIQNQTEEELYLINKHIYREYEYIHFDSTLHYIQKNRSISKKKKALKHWLESTFKLIYSLALNGREAEAYTILLSIERRLIPNEFLFRYYESYYNIYERIEEKRNNARYNLNDKTPLYTLYFDSLKQVKNQNRDRYQLIEQYKLIKENKYKQALSLSNQILKSITPNHINYSEILFYRASIHRSQKQLKEAKKFYLLSAINNIRNTQKNNASLTELAKVLYEEGQIERANRYIHVAMEDALYFNSSYRFVYLSNILPKINETYQKKITNQKQSLQRFGMIVSALLLTIIIISILLLKQFYRLRKAKNEIKNNNLRLRSLNDELRKSNQRFVTMNQELKEANCIKEQYIVSFVKICSDNIDKLDSLRRKTKKGIEHRNYKQLFESSKSTKIIDEELDEFYQNFDRVFLSIYPNFVDSINHLFLPEEKIVLKKPHLLTSEVRILALIRLGINESAKIAELLRYSSQTIYNYRVKIKNKAIGNRDNLENEILKIGAIDLNQTT